MSARRLYGCMGLGDDLAVAEAAVAAALESGFTRFDHADIYGRGSAEAVFGDVLRRDRDLRARITLQSKVGIRLPEDDVPGHYDLSGTAIRDRVHGSLERLGVDRLDVLLLHRPDPLAEPAEVADAVAALQAEGVVSAVGASNMSAAQLAALQDALTTPLVANQLEMSLDRTGFVDSTILVNHPGTGPSGAHAVDFPHGTLEHCRRHDIELQAWGALAGGRFSGRPPRNERDVTTSSVVRRLADEYGVAPEAVVLGWLMRHPARIAPVIGTTDPDRIRACADADAVGAAMTRPQWYELLETSRDTPVP